MRVLPPGGPPQRVSSGPFPGVEPHVFCERQNNEKNSQKWSLATFAKSERIKVIYQKILTWVPEMVYTNPRSLK